MKTRKIILLLFGAAIAGLLAWTIFTVSKNSSPAVPEITAPKNNVEQSTETLDSLTKDHLDEALQDIDSVTQ